MLYVISIRHQCQELTRCKFDWWGTWPRLLLSLAPYRLLTEMAQHTKRAIGPVIDTPSGRLKYRFNTNTYQSRNNDSTNYLLGSSSDAVHNTTLSATIQHFPHFQQLGLPLQLVSEYFLEEIPYICDELFISRAQIIW